MTEVREARDDAERAAAMSIRRAVFVEEQDVPEELEVDGLDDEAVHLVAVRDGVVVATCRLLAHGATVHLGRLAVDASARRQGIAVRVAKLPIAAVLRTRTTAETRGCMKALVAADSDRILGFTMLGAEAGEVMAVVQTAMLAGMPYTGLRDAILAHPTMAEGLGGLFSNVPGR